MEKLSSVVLALGSNLGDRFELISQAINEIAITIGSVKKLSKVYETPPSGFSASKKFLNMCIEVETGLTPEVCLKHINEIELKMGRVRSNKGYTSRQIDIDIIFFGNLVLNTSSLTIPHPKFHERNFVLFPLTDLDENRTDPLLGKTIKELLTNCLDEDSCIQYEKQFLDPIN